LGFGRLRTRRVAESASERSAACQTQNRMKADSIEVKSDGKPAAPAKETKPAKERKKR